MSQRSTLPHLLSLTSLLRRTPLTTSLRSRQSSDSDQDFGWSPPDLLIFESPTAPSQSPLASSSTAFAEHSLRFPWSSLDSHPQKCSTVIFVAYAAHVTVSRADSASGTLPPFMIEAPSPPTKTIASRPYGTSLPFTAQVEAILDFHVTAGSIQHSESPCSLSPVIPLERNRTIDVDVLHNRFTDGLIIGKILMPRIDRILATPEIKSSPLSTSLFWTSLRTVFRSTPRTLCVLCKAVAPAGTAQDTSRMPSYFQLPKLRRLLNRRPLVSPPFHLQPTLPFS